MTTLTFSHGIVRHSTDTGLPSGNQDFLVINSDKVDLHAPLDSSLVSVIAHRDTNYLLTLQANGDIQAWGYGNVANNNAPMDNVSGGGIATNEYYLYIDIDKVTGSVSYGYTINEPVAGTTSNFSPQNRPDNLHWFDTTQKITNVWQASGVGPAYGRWIEKIRLFVGKYIYSASFISMSINAPSFVGTQAGIVGTTRAGSLIFDVGGRPILRTDANNITVFFTTEDIITSGMPVTASPVSGNRMRFETFIVDAVGLMPAAAYSMVRFSDLNEVSPLAAATQANDLYGLIEFPIGASGDLIQVTMSGVIRNPLWTWSIVNQQIFVDKNNDGALVTVEDDGYDPLPNQVPVAFAIDKTSILLRRPEIALTTGSSSSGVTDHDDLLNKGSNTHASIDAHLADATLHYTVASIDHTLIANIGTNSHATIDAHLTNTSNPHSSSVDNLTDTVIAGAAKGDILVHDGSDWVDFTVGTNGQILTANSAQTEGLEWITAAAGLNNIVEDTTPELGGNLDVNTFTITGLPASPSNATEATSKAYVDALSAGLDPKESVRLGTTTNLATETGNAWVALGSGVGKTLTQTGVNTASIDGVAVVNGDRILVKDETIGGSPSTALGASNNGIYTVSGVAGVEVVLTRATDQDGSPSSEVSGGNFTYIEQGTQLGSGWVVVHNGLVTIDVSTMNWTQIGGTGGAFPLGSLTDIDDLAAHTSGLRVAFQGDGSNFDTVINNTLHDAATANVSITSGIVSNKAQIRLDNSAASYHTGGVMIDIGESYAVFGGVAANSTDGGYNGTAFSIYSGNGFDATGPYSASSGGAITISTGSGGDGTATYGPEQSGGISLSVADGGYGGSGNNGADGGVIQIQSGRGGDVPYGGGDTGGNGGDINLIAGQSGNGNYGGAGGSINLTSGQTQNTPGNPLSSGDIKLETGESWGTAAAGEILLVGGDNTDNGGGGHIQITGGEGNTLNGYLGLRTADTADTLEMRFYEDSGSGQSYIGLEAPLNLTAGAGTQMYVLPAADGTINNEALRTNASGVLSFSPVPYDVAAQAFGAVGTTVGTRVMHMIAIRAFRILNTGHRGHCVTGPGTVDAIFDVIVSSTGSPIETNIGSFTFTTGGGNNQSITATLTQTDIAAGDLLRIELSQADDGTLADVMMSIAAIEI